MKQGVTRRKVLAYMRKEPNAKAKEIARATGVSISCVYNVKHELRKAQKEIEQNAPALKLPPKLASRPIRIQYLERHEKELNKVADMLHTMQDARQRMLTHEDMVRHAKETLDTVGVSYTVDVVNHPPHYKVGGIEVIDFIESKGLTYNLGNVVKYVSRADHKGNKLEDLKKAQWYLNREVANLEKSK